MTVLVTGFGPFGPVTANPSEALLAHLPPRIGGHAVTTAVLPVDTEAVRPILDAHYAAGPDVVIHCGVARYRRVLSLERWAVNRLDFDLADNAGRTLRNQPIEPGGPEGRDTRLPVDAILAAWAEAGLPGAASADAGAYLCNQTFYAALSSLPPHVPAGFVHVPPEAHLPVPRQAEAVRLAVTAALTAREVLA